MLVIWITVAAITTFIAFFYISEYKKLKTKYNKFVEGVEDMYSNNLVGIYDGQYNYTHYQLKVLQLEKYKNGKSLLKFLKLTVDSTSQNDIKRVNEYIKGRFIEIQNTDKFDWLEIDKDVLEVRRDKLNRLLKEK